MPQRIRIESEDNKTRVFVDEREIKGVTSLDIMMSATEIPLLTLTIEAPNLKLGQDFEDIEIADLEGNRRIVRAPRPTV